MGVDPFSIASGVIGLGSAVYGGIQAGKERKKMASFLANEKNDNENWYNKEYYTDYTQRADTQNLIKNMRDNLRERDKITAGTAVVTGATPESVLAQKEANNKTMADTYSNISAMGARFKDNVSDKYLYRKQQIGGQEYGQMEQNANSYENMMSNGIGTMGNSVAVMFGNKAKVAGAVTKP